MKFKYGSLICGSVLGAAFFATGAAHAQDRSPAEQSRQTQTGAYMESRQGYQTSAPTGCVGCTPEVERGAGTAQAEGRPRRVGPPPTIPNPLPYDLLIQNGHVIDAKNNVDRVTDVAIKDGKIAAIGDNLNAKDAAKAVDVKGYIVTPGLIDIHVHVYASTGEKGSYAGDYSIWPDGFTFRNGVTTVVDAGSSGWRNFEDFKEHVIDRSQTRILADLNIVGAGMRGARFEDNLADMQAEPTAWMAKTLSRRHRRHQKRALYRTRVDALHPGSQGRQ